MSAPPRRLRVRGRTLSLGGRPLLMGIVNASPDSFSDAGLHVTVEQQLALAAELHAAGADILDVGGQSAITGRAPLPDEQEIERVVPLIERIVEELDVLVSVDTYKPKVARAAIEAGAAIVNDVSGLRDPAIADACAASGAALVLMHTRAAPLQQMQDSRLYDDVSAEVLAFLAERMREAIARGVDAEQLIIDPGPDFSKTPAQTIRVLRDLARLHELARPLLIAVSRKDFIGALTERAPRERLAGTLAALTWAVEQGAHILRVHDVAAAADFLTVHAALAGCSDPDERLALRPELRHEHPG